MCELWARKRTDIKGYPYEYILNFHDENYKYTAIDKLDKSIYQEAMIIKNEKCIMYVEFEKSKVKRKER